MMTFNDKPDISQGLATGLIVGMGLAIALFAAFVLQRAVSPPVKTPIVWRNVVSVKPDATYAEASPATAPATGGAAATDNIIYFAPTSATLPVLVSKVDAVFPKGAKGTCDSTVPMIITINTNGTPKNPGFRRAPGCGMEDAALTAVMNWRFRPAQLDGKALPVGAAVEVQFK